MTYVYLDCETTGLDPARHEIWEIAYAVDDGPIQSSAVWHEPPVVSPDVRAALRVNGYLDRCRLIPQSDSEYWEDDLKKLLDGATLVGANPAFDARMLAARWARQKRDTDPDPWHYRLLDIEAYAAGFLGWSEMRGLAETAEALGVAAPDHTAAGDVHCVRECWRAMRALHTGSGWRADLTAGAA